MPAADRVPATAAVLDDAVATGRALGGYLYVWHRGVVVADLAGGCAEPGVPARTADAGQLRCAVKPLTAICLARAMEAGLLDLDDRLGRWAPPEASPRIAGLTLRQLLSHRSGLPSYAGPGVYDVDFDGYVRAALTAEYPALMWDAQPVYNFARAWHLLAWVVQRVYGAPFPEVVTRTVTGPLGLSSLRLVYRPEAVRPYFRRVPGGGWAPIRETAADTFATRPNPAYGGGSTARDLGRMYVHLLAAARDDGRLLRPDTMRTLLRDSGGIRFGPRRPLLPFGLGFFRGGAAAGFGPEWDPGCFGHMGSMGVHHTNAALVDPAGGTVVAVRLSSVTTANNALFAAVGAALRADLGAGHRIGEAA
jgi:CubicO group peptidase (beta-lactamase class C family)